MDPQQLQKAGELLLKYGPKSISMDDIAAHLGISKKTIYKECSNKEDIIARVALLQMDCYTAEVAEVSQQAAHAVEAVFQHTRILHDLFHNLKAGFTTEMHKYAPCTWAPIEDKWLDMLRTSITESLLRGQREHLFRSDLDLDFTTRLRLSQIQAAFIADPLLPVDKDLKQTLLKVTEFYLQAICTEKGRALIGKHFKE